MNLPRAVARTQTLLNYTGKPARQPAAECSPPHLAWMLHEVEHFDIVGREDKANRWLGFVQGAMAAMGLASVEQLRRCNVDDGEAYDVEKP